MWRSPESPSIDVGLSHNRSGKTPSWRTGDNAKAMDGLHKTGEEPHEARRDGNHLQPWPAELGDTPGGGLMWPPLLAEQDAQSDGAGAPFRHSIGQS
jgi:hypothetical protein